MSARRRHGAAGIAVHRFFQQTPRAHRIFAADRPGEMGLRVDAADLDQLVQHQQAARAFLVLVGRCEKPRLQSLHESQAHILRRVGDAARRPQPRVSGIALDERAAIEPHGQHQDRVGIVQLGGAAQGGLRPPRA